MRKPKVYYVRLKKMLVQLKQMKIELQQMHDEMFRQLAPRLQGNTQFLSKMKPYWEYLLPTLPKRLRKPILKATTIEKYQAAVATALKCDW